MALKTEHFTTPIKLVLPGIIVSLIGLTASNFIFNDPVKIKGKHSLAAWNNLVYYQKIYDLNAEQLTCQYSSNIGGDYYFKDLIHLQEMTIENLKNLKEDKDLDKIVGSIINLRIDTYTQLKNLTVKFIDTLMFWDRIEQTLAAKDSASKKELAKIVKTIQDEYLNDRQHISTRDTSIISGLGDELKKTYAAFENSNFKSPRLTEIIDTIHRRMLGNWSMTKNGMIATVEFDGADKGSLSQNNKEEKFTWKFLGKDSTKLKIDFDNILLSDWPLDIPYCSETIMQYKEAENGVVLVACRIKE